PQPVQLRILGHARCPAGAFEPLGEADAVPGGLAVREENVRARLLQALEEDQQLEDGRVDRHPPRLLRLPARLVPADDEFARLEIAVGPPEVPDLGRPAAGEPQEDEHLAEAGGGAGALAPLAVGGADLAAAGIAADRAPLPCLPHRGVPE